jgi:hypothetical protein
MDGLVHDDIACLLSGVSVCAPQNAFRSDMALIMMYDKCVAVIKKLSSLVSGPFFVYECLVGFNIKWSKHEIWFFVH